MEKSRCCVRHLLEQHLFQQVLFQQNKFFFQNAIVPHTDLFKDDAEKNISILMATLLAVLSRPGSSDSSGCFSFDDEARLKPTAIFGEHRANLEGEEGQEGEPSSWKQDVTTKEQVAF